MSLEGIELETGRVQFSTSGIEILLEAANLTKHRSQLVVHLTETNCAKDGIPVGVTEGEDGTRAVSEDFESIGISVRLHEDEAEAKRIGSSNQCSNKLHLQGVKKVAQMNSTPSTSPHQSSLSPNPSTPHQIKSVTPNIQKTNHRETRQKDVHNAAIIKEIL